MQKQTKAQKTTRIRETLETLGINPKEQKEYTFSDLATISERARVQMYEVMSYLRYGKIV